MERFQLIKHRGDKIDTKIKNTLPQYANYKAHTQLYERPVQLGVSCSNTSDMKKNKICTAGTLGFLIEDENRTLYIVSTSNTLASTDSSIGDIISQPGDLDFGCRSNDKNGVAKLTEWEPITKSTDMDIAIAEIIQGKVDTTGAIYDVGLIKETKINNTQSPIIGKGVFKSGRTTGLTSGAIYLISASVNVYYDNLMVMYDDVFLINGNNFADVGDGGALVSDSSRKPSGILFAKGDALSVAFPIKNVIRKIQSLLGKQIKIKGQNRIDKNELIIKDDILKEKAINVLNSCKGLFRIQPGYIGVGIGQHIVTGKYSITLILDENIKGGLFVKEEIDGVHINIIKIKGPFRAI